MSLSVNLSLKDGRTHSAKIRTCAGGVARNMAEALKKLNFDPILLSALGNDIFGRELIFQFDVKKMDKSRLFSNQQNSAVYSAILNDNGECLFGIGDMAIHNEICSDYILLHSQIIESAPIVILDGNLSVETISTILNICSASSTPVWFEPTEIRKAKKICKVNPAHLKAVTYISPNINELQSILEEAGNRQLVCHSKKQFTFQNVENLPFQQNSPQIIDCFNIFPNLQIMLITQGKQGIWIIYKNHDEHSLQSILHDAPPLKPTEILSVSGAGDCLNAGFISGILHHLPLNDCAYIATQCAGMSLQSHETVPATFSSTVKRN